MGVISWRASPTAATRSRRLCPRTSCPATRSPSSTGQDPDQLRLGQQAHRLRPDLGRLQQGQLDLTVRHGRHRRAEAERGGGGPDLQPARSGEVLLLHRQEHRFVGSTVMNNTAAGNSVWQYNASNNPGRGVGTFARFAYNSLDTSDTVLGHGWSAQLAGPTVPAVRSPRCRNCCASRLSVMKRACAAVMLAVPRAIGSARSKTSSFASCSALTYELPPSPLDNNASPPPSRRARCHRLTVFRVTPSTSATLLCRIPCSNRSAACKRRHTASTRLSCLPVRVHIRPVCRTWPTRQPRPQRSVAR